MSCVRKSEAHPHSGTNPSVSLLSVRQSFIFIRFEKVNLRHFPFLLNHRKMDAFAASLVAYFVLAMGMNFANSWLYHKDKLNYGHPLLLTSMAFFIQYLLATFYIKRNDKNKVAEKNKKKPLGARDVALCAMAAALDLGLSNVSLRYVSLTVYVLIKSSCPVSVWVASKAMGLVSWKSLPEIVLIVFGTCMAVYPEKQLAGSNSTNSTDSTWVLGMLLVTGATVASGARWALTQKCVVDGGGPFSAIRVLSLPMAFLLFLVSLPVEGLHNVAVQGDPVLTLLTVLLMGVWTFALVAVEYVMVHRASALTLSVAGIAKELMMIGVGVFVFREHRLTLLNWSGIGLSLTGIAWHHLVNTHKGHKDQPQSGIEPSPLVDYLPDEIFAFSRPCSAIQVSQAIHDQHYFSNHGNFGVNCGWRSASVQPARMHKKEAAMRIDRELLAVQIAQLV